MKPNFEANRFLAYKEMSGPEYTAAGKAKFAQQLAEFALAGFPAAKWTKPLYKRLSLTFEHIAEFDQGGFFSTWFSNDRQKLEWIRHILSARCNGQPEYTHCDMEQAFQGWLRQSGLEQEYEGRIAGATEAAERRQLANLKAKYETT